MRIIFLDIDGVINSGKYREERHDQGLPTDSWALDPKCATWLLHTCVETDAYCVISSTWRYNWTLPAITENLWGAGLPKHRVIDKTPVYKGYNRGDEINSWLNMARMHGPEVESFVILDDDSDMGDLRPFLVKTDGHKGLTQEDALEAIRVLRGEPRQRKDGPTFSMSTGGIFLPD